jgi:hypothetical protein
MKNIIYLRDAIYIMIFIISLISEIKIINMMTKISTQKQLSDYYIQVYMLFILNTFLLSYWLIQLT